MCRAGCCVAGQHSTARLPRKLGKLGGEEQGEAILPEAERRDELLFLQTYLVRAPCGGSRCPLLCWHTRCSPTAVRPSTLHSLLFGTCICTAWHSLSGLNLCQQSRSQDWRQLRCAVQNTQHAHNGWLL